MSNSNKEILVIGSTGLQGGTVVSHLLAHGYRVRALCRDPGSAAARAVADKGVRVVRGDLEDRPSLDAAVKGVHGVFSVQNYWQGFPTAPKLGKGGEQRQGINLVEASAAAGVRHFIQSSGAGVTIAPELPVNVGKLAIEQRGRAIGLPITVMRPVFLMETFTNPLWGMRDALLDGRLDLPVSSETRLQLLAVDDLASFVIMALERPADFVGAVFDLASVELTMIDIAKTFERVMERPVRFTGRPENAEKLKEVDEDLAELFRIQLYERGFQAFVPALRALFPAMHTLESYLRKAGWENGGATLRWPPR